MSNAPKASGLSGISHAAGDRGVDATLAEVAERLAHRHRARGARVGGREDRPADVERDPEVGRRRAAEHREGEVRGDLADAPLEIPLVLLLGVGDAAQRRARGRSRSARARAPPSSPGVEPGVVEREPAGDQAELAEPVELAGGLGRHPGERVEVVDLRRDLRAERTRVEAVDALDRRARRPAVPRGTRRRRSRSAVMMPMPVIQTRRRSVMSVDSSRRAIRTVPARRAPRRCALNVASVRPAMGRVNQRSTTVAKTASRGREVVLDVDPAATRSRLDPPRDVHPARRPRHVDEPQAARRRLRPGPRAPGHGQAEAEDRDRAAAARRNPRRASRPHAVRAPATARSAGAAAPSARRRGPGRTRARAARRRRSRSRCASASGAPDGAAASASACATSSREIERPGLVGREPAARVGGAVCSSRSSPPVMRTR